MQLRPTYRGPKKNAPFWVLIFLAHVPKKGNTDAPFEELARSNDIARSRFATPRNATGRLWCFQHLLSRVGTLTLSH